MNRKEFQEWLDQFPEDTVIQVVEANSSSYLITTRMVEFNADLNQYYFTDLTNNPFVEESSPHSGKKFLELGSE